MAEENPIHTKGLTNVVFQSYSECPAYLAETEGSTKGVVVIQEW